MKKIITLCLLAFIGITQVNAQCVEQNTTVVSTVSQTLIGQSFTPLCSGNFTELSLPFIVTNFTGTLIVVYGNNNISGMQLYSQAIAISAPESVPTWKTITLTTPLSVTAGETYTVFINGSSSYTTLFYAGSTYSRGNMWYGSSGYPNYDIGFIAKIEPAVTCTPTTSTTNLSICPSELPYTWNGKEFATAGSDTVHLTNAAGCDSIATLNLTLKPSPAIGTSSISGALCSFGATRTLYNTNTNGGGVWSSSNPKIAPVSTLNGASGTVLCDGNGTVTLTYTKTGTNGCQAAASITVLMTPVKAPAAITGTNTVCKAATTTLSSTTNGGVWSSLNGYASVNNAGVVTGLSAGAAVIRYTVSNGACSAFASYNVTVNGIPAVPTIGYAPGTVNPQTGGGAFCTNRNFTVVGTPTGGIWSSTGVLAVNANTGAVATGNTPGVASLTYTTTVNGCSNSRTIAATVVGCGARGINAVHGQQSTVDFTIYPNPAKSFITLNVETLVGAGSIIVTNLYGKQVATQTLSMGTNTIDVSTLSKGMYFVSMITSEGKITKKFIVE